ncbi:hypothetical protein NXX09_19860 [Bacteroides uniformis]|nr:hypothetical protein [Bacteroides uniformis]
MKNQELIRHLKAKGYRRVTLETDSREPKTYYTYRRGLHINATETLSFHIVPPSQSLGTGKVRHMCDQGRCGFPGQERIVPECFSRACCRF